MRTQSTTALASLPGFAGGSSLRVVSGQRSTPQFDSVCRQRAQLKNGTFHCLQGKLFYGVFAKTQRCSFQFLQVEINSPCRLCPLPPKKPALGRADGCGGAGSPSGRCLSHFEGSEVKTSSRRASRAGFSAASVSKQAFGLGPTGACASFNYFLMDLSNKPGKSLCLNHSTGVQLCLWHRFSCVCKQVLGSPGWLLDMGQAWGCFWGAHFAVSWCCWLGKAVVGLACDLPH